jgi:hypothetical protein
MRGPLFACLAAFGVACSAASDPASSQRAPIISGHASDASQDFVVLLVHYDASQGIVESCTGSLLAPNLVLTARHCVSNTDQQGFACDANGNSITGGGKIGSDFPASTLSVYYGENRPTLGLTQPDAKGAALYHDGATNLCNHDLALVLLDRSIPGADIAPIRLDSPPTAGERTDAVGWGLVNNSSFPSVRQQRDNVLIQIVGPFGGTPNQLPVAPNDFLVGESICSGDSGGPSLDMTTGAILGVVSAGGNNTAYDPNNPAGTCIGATNYYTRVDGFSDVILQAYADAGQDPWLEGGPDPRLAKFGEPCSTGADCRSGLCLDDGTCTQDCTADPTSCPDGYDCTALSDTQSQCTVHAGGCETGGRGGNAAGLFCVAFALLGLVSRRRS